MHDGLAKNWLLICGGKKGGSTMEEVEKERL